ncbi:ester cyclase [Streptomyces winkii]|uniref:ester cyclase n=1 Tax=Streptomyces winkii TaxID=3051178 RepID=UPI0028D43757|nr:ester cyclase [Streptomyces sp. DSM 40971]
MSEPTTPAEVVRAVAAGVSRLVSGGLDAQQRAAQLDALAAYYAEDTDVRHPFAPLGDTPLRTRNQLRDHFAAGADGIDAESFAPADAVVHETADPEVVVFEFAYRGQWAGRPFAVPNIFVVRVRNGVIVESRDYAHHVGFARASGRINDLAAALTQATADAVTASGRHLYATLDTQDWARILELVSPDVVVQIGSEPVMGLTRWRSNQEAFYRAFPDGRHVIEDALVDKDRFVTRCRFVGTHTGPFQEFAPTGKKVSVGALHIDRFDNGLLAEHHGQFDIDGLRQQIAAT